MGAGLQSSSYLALQPAGPADKNTTPKTAAVSYERIRGRIVQKGSPFAQFYPTTNQSNRSRPLEGALGDGLKRRKSPPDNAKSLKNSSGNLLLQNDDASQIMVLINP